MQIDAIETLLEQRKECVRQDGCPESKQRILYYGTYEKEVADEGVRGCCLERRSFISALSSLYKRRL